MELNKIYQEPCNDTMSKMPDKFLDSVVCSPPYWQLRDYGYPEQWGLEPTYQEYLEHLWSMMDLIWLKLKDCGTVWINLGDTYNSNSKGSGGCGDNTYITNRQLSDSRKIKTSEPDKCLLLLPHRFAIGCIDRGWILRNDVIWAKRNGMPESVTDRFSKKHEFFFFFAKQQKYYFDLDAIKDRTTTKDNLNRDRDTTKLNNCPGRSRMGGLKENNYDTKNPGDVSDFWDIPTKPSSEKHYASYNDALLRKPILAGCPENGIVYDPFTGTGSTAEVCLRSKRNFIGSEMSKEYCDIAEKRLSPYLQQIELF